MKDNEEEFEKEFKEGIKGESSNLIVLLGLFLIAAIALIIYTDIKYEDNLNILRIENAEYKIDGAIVYNSYLYSQLLKDSNGAANDIKLKEDWTNRFYSILQDYNNKKINNNIKNLNTCTKQLNALFADSTVPVESRQEKYTECNKIAFTIDEFVFDIIKTRYSGLGVFK